MNACGKDALQRQTQAETNPRKLRRLTLSDLRNEIPCDPKIGQADDVRFVLMYGAVVVSGVIYPVRRFCGTWAECLIILTALAAVFALTAGILFLGAMRRLREINRICQNGKCITAEILGCKRIGGARRAFYVSGIRLPDGTEFFSPHYHTPTGAYNRCDVYIWKRKKYLTNFRREHIPLTEE